MNLRDRGFDGSFGVSVDAFHGKDPAKPALFIETASEIWNRPDIARVIAVKGARDKETNAILRALAGALKAKLVARRRAPGHQEQVLVRARNDDRSYPRRQGGDPP